MSDRSPGVVAARVSSSPPAALAETEAENTEATLGLRGARRWRGALLGPVAGLALAAWTSCAARAPGPSAVAAAAPAGAVDTAALLAPERLARMRAYIRKTWDVLTRDARDLPAAAVDPKAPHVDGAPWPVYVAGEAELSRVRARLPIMLAPEALRTIQLRALPPDPREIREHGLLYLPRPYVVPGGRFNEMYGWDSYFILLGLLRDGETTRARDLTDDQLYEVEAYGSVLNANRTYYLTRSQPPFLSQMVLAVFRATSDAAWLAASRQALVDTYRHWTRAPHLIEATGLSRYYDHGDGPAPEVVYGERDAAGRSHYDRVRDELRKQSKQESVARFYRRETDELTPLFYKGDRSMRESGFDPSDRFGRFGADVVRFAPVCLNTLLYQMERDLAEIDTRLGRTDDVAAWNVRAEQRRALIDRYLWDQRAGLYLDYDFEAHQRRDYPFATTFWPLAAGIASPEQARRVRDNLPLLERPGGILTSTQVSGAQWDAPFGWAPLQLFATRGLRRAGFTADADRVAREFLSMLVEDFERRGTLVEKYDVERRTSETGGQIKLGYQTNEVGFGWTNGVALELAAALN